ncbi:MAG TPA: DUF4390 domain-containing protein [Vicinamibacterales bacterium]|nr:DUF4390 domain-containing protein [Vicinamibacterales bacterium]
MRRLLALFVLFLALGVSDATPRAAESLRILPVVRGEHVLISFELADAFTAEIREVIASGLRTTFTYNVELRMEVPVWVDRTIASAVVSTSDDYDNLTRRHSLVRTLDGRVEEAIVTDDEAVVRRFMTTLERMPMFRTSRLEPNRTYYVRVSVRARPNTAPLLGWVSAITGQARFTFIP